MFYHNADSALPLQWWFGNLWTELTFQRYKRLEINVLLKFWGCQSGIYEKMMQEDLLMQFVELKSLLLDLLILLIKN